MKSNLMLKKLFYFRYWPAVFTALFFLGCMKGSSEYDHGINAADKTFVSQALHLHEIIASASAIVPERSDSNELEIFAANAHSQHLRLFNELDSVNNFIQLKAGVEVNRDHVELNNKLIPLTGRQFDSGYLYNMLYYHQKAVEIYNKQLAAGSNSSLKNFTGKKIEFLKAQLIVVESLYKKYQ